MVLHRPFEPTSVKGEVKKKHISFGRKFSCFSAQLFEQDLFWPAAPYARLLGTAQGYWFSLPAVFIAFRNEACQFPKPTKQNVGHSGDHGSIWDSWPMAFSGYPRGPRVGCETRCRSTQRLTNQLRLALEPECLENPTATAREDSQDGADSIRDTQAVCGFRCWASKHTPLFHTISTIVAIFLAKVRRAISGRIPLATKAV